MVVLASALHGHNRVGDCKLDGNRGHFETLSVIVRREGMRIVFAGRVTLKTLVDCGKWDRPLPEVKWGFPLGSEIVKRLVGRGHTVVVVTEHTVDVMERFKCQTERGGLEVWLVPSRKRSRWTFLTLFSKEVGGIRTTIKDIKPDVVFAQWTYHNAYAGLTSGYPTLVVAHDSPWRVVWTMRTLIFLIKAIYSQLFVLPKIMNLSVVSPHIGKDFRKMGYKGQMTLIGNGCSIESVSQGFVSDGAVKVVMVTQWGRLKNSKAMLKAWRILHGWHNDWRLVVYGNYMDERGAEPWMRKTGLGYLIDCGAVGLKGFVGQAQIRDELKTAYLFVSPSLEESFGMVFVEAMLLGVPCIGGEKSGAVPWVIGDGGVVCDVTKPEKLAECIERVMGDIELRKKMGEGGKRRVCEMFDIEKVVDKYEAELKKVAGC